MKEQERLFKHNITRSTDDLKRLILEHPDYPIVVLAGEEANGGDYSWMFCSDISFSVGEVLTVETPYDAEIVCCDRDTFYEEMQSWLEDRPECAEMTDAEFEERLQREPEKYDDYWEKVIVVWASN